MYTILHQVRLSSYSSQTKDGGDVQSQSQFFVVVGQIFTVFYAMAIVLCLQVEVIPEQSLLFILL
jgi:hypothetical protein